MSGLRELYQEMILDHSRHPRNRRAGDAPTGTANGHNPLCGDRLTVYVTVDPASRKVVDACFEGIGCAISTASASMMSEAVRGLRVEEAEQLFERFHDLLTGKPLPEGTDLGKLQVFSGVVEFPVRVKCATLAWHTLRAALAGSGAAISTE